MQDQILPKNKEGAIYKPTDISKFLFDVGDRLFGFDGKECCVIGKLTVIVKSAVDPKFDLAYIERSNGAWKVGLLSDLRPTLNLSQINKDILT